MACETTCCQDPSCDTTSQTGGCSPICEPRCECAQGIEYEKNKSCAKVFFSSARRMDHWLWSLDNFNFELWKDLQEMMLVHVFFPKRASVSLNFIWKYYFLCWNKKYHAKCFALCCIIYAKLYAYICKFRWFFYLFSGVDYTSGAICAKIAW